ncbi:MAG: tetratricopeptide repeat protein [Candidatus Aminicenantes bacterium]|nr:tetratricopeptide repeat protein [Candidatus Aminicenantes bacterium]
MKGKERHHLKENGFAHGLEGIWQFLKKWRREFVMAGLLVIGLAVVFAVFQVVRGQQAKSYSRQLGEIQTLRADLPKVPENAAKLEALAGKGKYGRVASLSLATYWVEQGQPDKAEAALAAIKETPKDLHYYQAKDLSAQIAARKGDIDGALAILKKIVDENPREYLLDAVLYQQAELLEKKGRTAEALALYKKLETDYAQSYYGYDASLRARKLEAAGKHP